jgi:Tol biopolymer transport system component
LRKIESISDNWVFPMKGRLSTIIALSFCFVMLGCNDSGVSYFAGGGGGAGGGGDGGGDIPGGGDPGGGGPGSLGTATLVYAESGGGGFDNVLVNGAGTMAVFIASSNPLATNPGEDDQLFAQVFGDAEPVQLTTGLGAGFRNTDDFDINANGSTVVFVSDQDITGDNPTGTLNLFAAATDGSSVTQVTSLTSGSIANPGISGDGSLLVFTSSEDLTGGNPMNDTQIFSVAADGSNLTQVTTGTTAAEEVEISDNGNKLVWVDTSDPFGTNGDGSREIFAMNIDGTNHMQLTMSSGDSMTPRISDNGAYAVFVSGAEFSAGSNPDGMLEVYTVATDGTGITQITDSALDSGLMFNGNAPAVDISGNGSWITFMSYADINGTNSDSTYTVYWADRSGTFIEQLLREETKPEGVSSRFAEVPRMNDDGSQIVFSALAPYSTDAPDTGWKMFAMGRL